MFSNNRLDMMYFSKKKIILLLILLLTLKTEIVSAAPSSGSSTSDLIPRGAIDKQSIAAEKGNYENPSRLVVKFNEGSKVRLSGTQLQTELSADTTTDDHGLKNIAKDLSKIKNELSRRRLGFSRMFSQDVSRLAELRQRGQTRSRRQLADLSLYFQIPASKFPDIEMMERLKRFLNSLDCIEFAYIEDAAIPAQVIDPDSDTDDFTSLQGYKEPAPVGIDAEYAATIPGGLGAGVSVIDVEQAWNVNHEDFPPMAYTLGSNSTSDSQSLDHGTAVVGIVAAPDNGFGITGITPNVRMGISGYTESAPEAIIDATDALNRGDIIIIEIHRPGPVTKECVCKRDECGYLPIEYWPADFDAIATATANGIIVVEAGGNGSINLENPIYRGVLNANTRDSGAILVGASMSTERSPMCFSNYGTRIDMHAWGENVTTLGYGKLNRGEATLNEDYTDDFGGTSSASPIVAGAAAALQGIALNMLNRPLSPAEMRGLLRATGTPQTGELDRPIGPMPNLKAAIDQLLSGTFDPVASFTHTCDDQGVCTYIDTSHDLLGDIVNRTWTFADGTISNDESPVHTYASFGNHPVTLTVTDNEGNTNTTSGNTRISTFVCSEDHRMFFEDFEEDFGPFTTVGNVSRSRYASHDGNYGVRVRGEGAIETILDVRGWADFTFSGWAEGVRFENYDVLYFEFCPLRNGVCNEDEKAYQEAPIVKYGMEEYNSYTIQPWSYLDHDLEYVKVVIGSSATGTRQYAHFDDILVEGKHCEEVECLSNAFCDNGIYCDGRETCNAGVCQPGIPPCPGSTCNEAQDSCACTEDSQCNDETFCNGQETCIDGACVPGTPPCPDGNCNETAGSCGVEQTCMTASATNDAHVSAGRAYTEITGQDCTACRFGCRYPSGCATDIITYYAVGSDIELGSNGADVNVLYSENQGESWSTTECESAPCQSDNECNDGLLCNGTETCIEGECQKGRPIVCDDHIACTQDSCDEATGTCRSTPIHSACDDENECTQDSCDLSVGCQNPIIPDCPICLDIGEACESDDSCCSKNCYGFFRKTCR